MKKRYRTLKLNCEALNVRACSSGATVPVPHGRHHPGGKMGRGFLWRNLLLFRFFITFLMIVNLLIFNCPVMEMSNYAS